MTTTQQVHEQLVLSWDEIICTQGKVEEVLENICDHEYIWQDFDDASEVCKNVKPMCREDKIEYMKTHWQKKLRGRIWQHFFTNKQEVENEYLSLAEKLQCLMLEFNRGGQWWVRAENYGKDLRSGWKTFKSACPHDFLVMIMPSDDYPEDTKTRRGNSFRIYMAENYIKIQHTYGKSPDGLECYYAYPAVECFGCAGLFRQDECTHIQRTYELEEVFLCAGCNKENMVCASCGNVCYIWGDREVTKCSLCGYAF